MTADVANGDINGAVTVLFRYKVVPVVAAGGVAVDALANDL